MSGGRCEGMKGGWDEGLKDAGMRNEGGKGRGSTSGGIIS